MKIKFNLIILLSTLLTAQLASAKSVTFRNSLRPFPEQNTLQLRFNDAEQIVSIPAKQTVTVEGLPEEIYKLEIYNPSTGKRDILNYDKYPEINRYSYYVLATNNISLFGRNFRLYNPAQAAVRKGAIYAGKVVKWAAGHTKSGLVIDSKGDVHRAIVIK